MSEGTVISWCTDPNIRTDPCDPCSCYWRRSFTSEYSSKIFCAPPSWGIGLNSNSEISVGLNGNWYSNSDALPDKPPIFPPAIFLSFQGADILSLDPKSGVIRNFRATGPFLQGHGSGGSPIYGGEWGARSVFTLPSIQLVTKTDHPPGSDIIDNGWTMVWPYDGPMPPDGAALVIGWNLSSASAFYSADYQLSGDGVTWAPLPSPTWDLTINAAASAPNAPQYQRVSKLYTT